MTAVLAAINLTAMLCDLSPLAAASGHAPDDTPLRRHAKTLRRALLRPRAHHPPRPAHHPANGRRLPPARRAGGDLGGRLRAATTLTARTAAPTSITGFTAELRDPEHGRRTPVIAARRPPTPEPGPAPAPPTNIPSPTTLTTPTRLVTHGSRSDHPSNLEALCAACNGVEARSLSVYGRPQVLLGAAAATRAPSKGPTPDGLVPVQGSEVVIQPHCGLSGDPNGM
jgi:hypothetical protein